MPLSKQGAFVTIGEKMKRRIYLFLSMVAIILCVLAIFVSASTIYKTEAGEQLFTYEQEANKVISSYEGSFPKTDSDGNALIWYVSATETVDSDTVHTVKSFKALGESGDVYGSVNENGYYSVTGVNGNKIVSFNLPNDSGIKIIDVNFGGGWTGSFPNNSQILFAYLPNTLEKYEKGSGGNLVDGAWTVQRIFQLTPILECYFSDLDTSNPNHMTTIGNFDFYGCKNLRKCVLPNGITTIFGDRDHNSGPAFRECWNLREIVIPNTVTTIGPRAFESCGSLATVYFGANADFVFRGNTTTGSVFNGTGSLKKVYLSDTFKTAANAMFNSSANDAVFFYAGTYEEYVALNEALKTAGNNTRFTDATPILWDSANDDSYYTDLATSQGKRYVVYGYNKCNAFFGGVHKVSGEASMILTSYFEPITFVANCENGCGMQAADESKTIGAIFTYRGYSCTEVKIGGFYSMTQAYSVNEKALNQYRQINPSFAYGLVASGYSNPLDENVDSSKVITYPGESFTFNHFEIKVKGISGRELVEKKIVFCLYIIDNSTYYADGGIISENANGISFSQVYAIKFPNKELEA